MAIKASSVTEWIKRYLKEEQPRSKSLMVSAFGDSIAPLSPGIWLGDLITLMSPFGVSERLVRTSAFRLVDEGWLQARRDGRRSYYSLTQSGTHRFELAYGRIYTPPEEQWNEDWTVVLLPRNGETHSERLELRRELEWEGFTSPAPGVMLHPAANHDVLRQILKDRGVIDRAVVMKARSIENFSAEPVNALIARYWNLGEVEKMYARFIARFEPLLAKFDSTAITPQQAFAAQTLLIHSFRRATLHDPRLPASLLSPTWPGMDAFKLTRQIYEQTYRPTQAHLKSAMHGSEQDRLPRLGEHVRERFGGLR